MSNDIEKLRSLRDLIDDTDAYSGDVAELHRKIEQILDEPEIGVMKVEKTGYGQIIINGVTCDIVPEGMLARSTAITPREIHEKVLDAVHRINQARDLD